MRSGDPEDWQTVQVEGKPYQVGLVQCSDCGVKEGPLWATGGDPVHSYAVYYLCPVCVKKPRDLTEMDEWW